MLKNHDIKKCKWDRIQKDRETKTAEKNHRELEKMFQELRELTP